MLYEKTQRRRSKIEEAQDWRTWRLKLDALTPNREKDEEEEDTGLHFRRVASSSYSTFGLVLLSSQFVEH